MSVSSYRHHKENYVSNDEYNESLDKYERILNACSYHNLWYRKTSTNFVITLENDLGLNNEQFFTRLLQKIFLAPFFMDKDLSENKKMFLRGFFETRGSIDTSLSFLTLDYFYNSSLEAKTHSIFD